MEPTITDEERLESNWKCCADNLKKYYDPTHYTNLNYQFGEKGAVASLGPINETPASNARLFQNTTGILSKTLWLIPFGLFAFSFIRALKKKPLLRFSFSIPLFWKARRKTAFC
jgi:hypothetical protein